MTTRFIVKAGSCMNGGDGRVCAFQPTDCPQGTSFVTPRMLEQSGSGNAHGGACATNDGTENVAKIGSCSGGTEEGYCASDVSLCADPQTFVSVDDRCTIRVASLKQTTAPTPTLFGKCMADNTCYWSQQDCSDPTSWEKPNTGGTSACTCEEVRVGACVDDQGFYYCAVSEGACSLAGTWMDASTLMLTSTAPECFLCRQEGVQPIQGRAPSSSPSKPPTSGTTPPQSNTNSGGSDLSLNVKRDGSNGNHTAIIVGVSVGGGLVLLGLLLLLFMKRRSRPTNKTVSDIPVEAITDTSGNQDMEDLSVDGEIQE